ncbi:acyltransferase family protein [Sporosarcina sp. GW1-11]|uniref:acyltransferase family protein n=1 Tax=Sporosarcina sp. GW1-11 TaxID=2899126 RepID=UPI00294C6970|nr:acyltransferase family protein [Sporosarcina sp. GW1-11]MDV6377852.1 acyltransferase family protein [Sporosarcina sp. GW1-11]
MNKKRLTWVDGAKGFLMILVVIGHYPGQLEFPLAKYIYWFHMPAFFILSGLFFKPVLEKGFMRLSIHKRFMQLIVPYLFFLLSITLIRYGIEISSGNMDISWYAHDFWTLVVGGRFARGAYGVFWFVTTLFFTYLFFLWLTTYFSRTKQIIILIISYCIAHYESIFAMRVIGGAPDTASQTVPMIWNIDVALMAVIYFSLGYYMKSVWMNISGRWLIAGLVGSVVAIVLDAIHVIDYHLSMKFLRYEHFILDLIIPLSFTLVVVGVFQRMAAKLSVKWLQKIEKHSLTIMYLHIFTDILLNDYFTYGIVGFTAFGLGIPILFSIIIQKYLPNGKVLVGGFSPKKINTSRVLSH